MHELGIACQLLKTLEDIKAEQGLSEIGGVTLQLGEMSDVIPRFLENAWSRIAPAIPLSIEVVPARARCSACGREDLVKNLGMQCPECGSYDFKIISGREFLIKDIKAK